MAALVPGHAAATDARGRDVIALNVGVPQGFGDLARSQRAVVDIDFGGRRIGQAEIIFQPGQLSFVDIDAVIAMLPNIADPAQVRSALAAAPLDTHAEALCASGSDGHVCGHLQPDVAGIIFDQDRFRLSLFINPRFLKIRAATDEIFLPRPKAGPSLVDSIAGTLAGGSNGDRIYAVQNRAVLGDHDARIIATTTYASGAGLQADVLAAQIDKPDRRYTLGAFWAPGLDLIGRRKVLGAGVETQFDTRSDKALISGSPIVVSLSQRSRVDVLVNGRLMASRTYEAGNQSLDTSGLPDGAYEVTLHVQEVGGASRDERRFFTKNPKIAPIGKPIWFIHGGVLVDETNDAFLSLTHSLYLGAGLARRFGQTIAMDGTVIVAAGKGIGEVGTDLILPRAQIRLAALVSTKRDCGFLFQVNSANASRLTFDIDLRRIHSHDDGPLLPIGDGDSVAAVSINAGYQGAQLSSGTFTQALADIGYRLNRAQVGLSLFYRQDARRAPNYAIGPTGRWSAFHRGGIDLTLEANISQSNLGRSAFAGVRLRYLRPHSSFGASGGAQTVASGTSGQRSSVVGGVQGTWQREDVLGGDLMLAGNYDHTPEGDLAHARADMRGPLGTVAADLVQQVGRTGNTQYSLGVQTGVVVNRSVIALGGKEHSDSVVAVRVDDAAPRAAFQILVDETPRGIVHGGQTVSIPVTPYRQYDIRIKPLGGDLVHFENASRRVSVYPGNVVALDWVVKPVVAMFGRIEWADGTPIDDADLLAGDAIGHTDRQGYFLIETSPGTEVTVRAADGRACHAVLKGREGDTGYAAIGTILCYDRRGPTPPLQIATIRR